MPLQGDCLFCSPQFREKTIARGKKCYVVEDAYPVTEGHMLVIPNRHAPTMLDLWDDEYRDIMDTVKKMCAIYGSQCDGFNVGMNIGRAAGQTIMHCHIHVIPRRIGDMADPRGGVRHVIPEKGNYLTKP